LTGGRPGAWFGLCCCTAPGPFGAPWFHAWGGRDGPVCRMGDVRGKGSPLGVFADLAASIILGTVSIETAVASKETSSPWPSVTSTLSNRLPSSSSSNSAENDSPRCSVRVRKTWLGRIGVLCGSRFIMSCSGCGGGAKSGCLYRLVSANLMGLTVMAWTFLRYVLSYKQLPRTLPNVRSERFKPSVAASFFAFSNDAALPLPFSIEP